MYKVFICSNKHQMIGAKVSKFSIISREPELKHSVQVISDKHSEDLKGLYDHTYKNSGEDRVFDGNDLQSFTLLRFLPPKLMSYKGRALVIDPDVFLVKSGLTDLLNKNMNNAAIFSKKGMQKGDWVSSVMLLDCEKLKHWDLSDFIFKLKKGDLDYRDVMNLRLEKELILPLENRWNDFDSITDNTMLLHTTQRVTQPWRTGLKVNSYFKPVKPILGFIPRRLVHRILKKPMSDRHIEHPSKVVSDYFFNELNSAVKEGFISKEEIIKAIDHGYIRKDIFKKLSLG